MIATNVEIDLTFNAETHEYRKRNGTRVPNATRILDAAGLRMPISQIPPDVLEFKRVLGSAVHEACHYLDEGTLDWDSVDERIEPRLFAWERFKKEWYFEPTQMETVVYSARYGVCGRMDRLGYRREPGKIARQKLLEIKTGDPKAAGAKYQLALYHQCWTDMFPKHSPFMDRVAVWLKDDGNYSVSDYGCEARHINLALSAVSLYHERVNEGLLAA